MCRISPLPSCCYLSPYLPFPLFTAHTVKTSNDITLPCVYPYVFCIFLFPHKKHTHNHTDSHCTYQLPLLSSSLFISISSTSLHFTTHSCSNNPQNSHLVIFLLPETRNQVEHQLQLSPADLQEKPNGTSKQQRRRRKPISCISVKSLTSCKQS